ncbi:MAG: HdeD family acid-resistance protein [Candidatus Eremiobacteraeota bacterium]|nr:HdeD family acid-resistance protein [Candidatus Eremiobacteraeota bacterium]
MPTDFAQAITGRWWTFLVRGVFALLLAAVVFLYPIQAATGLVYLVAAYFVISGVTQIAGGVAFAGAPHWWLLILTGAMSVFLGFIMFTQPGMGPLALAYLVAIYAIFNGITEVASGMMLGGAMPHSGWWILLGVLTWAFGIYIIFNPALGVAALVYAVGFYAVIVGVALVAFAFRLKSAGTAMARPAHA